jgi:hypothetical protein
MTLFRIFKLHQTFCFFSDSPKSRRPGVRGGKIRPQNFGKTKIPNKRFAREGNWSAAVPAGADNHIGIGHPFGVKIFADQIAGNLLFFDSSRLQVVDDLSESRQQLVPSAVVERNIYMRARFFREKARGLFEFSAGSQPGNKKSRP